jgi:hypothetical protein
MSFPNQFKHVHSACDPGWQLTHGMIVSICCHMKDSRTLNVYLPDDLYSEISREARRTGQTKGRVVRERLAGRGAAPTGAMISDLFGVAGDLPRQLSTAADKAFSKYGADGHR